MVIDFAEFTARGLVPAAPIEAAVDIEADAADVWAAISEVGNLTNVHPFCATNEVDRWPGLNSRDHVRYYSGVHYQRDVVDWWEGEGYEFAVGPPTGPISLARWSIEANGLCRCRFAIEVTSFVKSDVSAEVQERYTKEVINEAIPPYLDGVVQGVRYFVETGRPVVRNQFGAHKIYSPEVS